MTEFISGIPNGARECLWQLFVSGPVRDGALVCKESRNRLIENQYAARSSGYNFLTKAGVDLAVKIGFGRRKDREGAHN